ncbi:MAG: LamG-like jellyroll fold domain-containing protein [Planctomycetota bacterium]
MRIPSTFRLLVATSTLSMVMCVELGLARAQGSTTAGSGVVVTQHPHYHSHPHPTKHDAARFSTTRASDINLPLPTEADAFTFAVFGDRTGGPPEGIEILKQAVADTNLFEPDLVMTVGDLIEGYNDTAAWKPQMQEYKSVMGKLLCPWFPVAGNHDVYFRGENRPKLHHEANYEMHFGPLWYAFEHKGSWFVVLFSDEGNAETGEKSFNEPELQRMSPEQFEWLKSVLTRAKSADHVFVFLHHPRWLGRNYGDDWQKVHQALVEAGNVRAVFAGHIHRMRYDGPRDGIEYVTLATVGGGQSGLSEDAGFLHHYNLVTVRKQQIAMACIPVGEVMNLREVTGKVSEDIQRIAATPPDFPRLPTVTADGATSAPTVVELFNPSSQPVEYELRLDPEDAHWISRPDHIHRTLYAGQKTSVPLELKSIRIDEGLTYEAPQLQLRADYLADNARFSVRERNFAIPVRFEISKPAIPEQDLALRVSEGDYVAVQDLAIDMPDGPMTLECWCKPSSFGQRVGLITKTQGSDYGLFVSGGIPYFTIHLGGNYVQPTDLDWTLKIGSWQHVAGVFDGKEVRTYVDGKLVSRGPGRGERRKNRLPLIVGADVDGAGGTNSPFDGLIDSVRLSKGAKYAGESFVPERRLQSDDETALLLNFDAFVGPLAYDESGGMAHARRFGNAELLPAD